MNIDLFPNWSRDPERQAEARRRLATLEKMRQVILLLYKHAPNVSEAFREVGMRPATIGPWNRFCDFNRIVDYVARLKEADDSKGYRELLETLGVWYEQQRERLEQFAEDYKILKKSHIVEAARSEWYKQSAKRSDTCGNCTRFRGITCDSFHLGAGFKCPRFVPKSK